MPTPPTWRQRLNHAAALTLSHQIEFRRLVDAGVCPATARHLATRPAAVAAGRRTMRSRRAA